MVGFAGYDGLPIESGMQGLDINGPGGGGGGENSVYGTYGNQNDEDTLQHYTNNQTGNKICSLIVKEFLKI